jgi:hypothetical protein
MSVERVKDKENLMSTYTDELKQELDRVTIKGNPDKNSFAKLASIIWRMDQRIQKLEEEIVVDDKPVKKIKTTKKED